MKSRTAIAASERQFLNDVAAPEKGAGCGKIDLGPTRIHLGSSRCRDGGGRSFVKRAVSDSAQPETAGGPPAPKRTMSGNCDEEREEAHTEAPVSVSPEGRGIYLCHEKGNTSDRISLRSASSRAGSERRRGQHRGTRIRRAIDRKETDQALRPPRADVE